MQKDNVFINNYRAITPNSKNAQELYENICNFKSAITLNDTYIKDKIVALGISKVDLQQSLIQELEILLENSDLKDYNDTLLLIGSSVGGMKLSEDIYLKEQSYENINPALHVIDSINYQIQKHFVFKDSASFSTACTSSANALGYAYEVISKKIYKNVVVIGFDTLCKTTIGGFNALGVLSSNICKPFDKTREGMNISESLAILLLQNQPNKNSVQMYGVGYSSDAFHMTKPEPNGACKAMANALSCNCVNPNEVDYINAHGTGTIANDENEITAIKLVFGTSIPISSTKAVTGHTLGTAGALEAIICIMAIQQQTLLPNFNLQDSEFSDVNFVKKATKAKIKYALSNSFAFGGNNTSLLFKEFI